MIKLYFIVIDFVFGTTSVFTHFYVRTLKKLFASVNLREKFCDFFYNFPTTRRKMKNRLKKKKKKKKREKKKKN